MIIAWVAMLIFACHASTHMVAAGDTWVAMACGRHFINHGVSTFEPFSAYSHKAGPTPEEVKTWPKWAQWLTDKVGIETVKYWHPTGWVNQNWLTHVMFYWLTHLSPFADAHDWSFNTLVYWKFAVYIITIICTYYIGRVLGANPALSAVFACFALFIGRSFLDIRPAGYSNLLVAVFILILALGTYRSYLYLWLIVPLIVFWANVHGGYIYVFIILAPFFVLHLLPILPRRWTVCLMSILTWLALYVVTYKFLNHQPFSAPSPPQDRLFQMVLIFSAAGVTIALLRNVKDAALYTSHILATVIVFLALLPRFFPDRLTRYTTEVIEYVQNSRQTYLVTFMACVGLGVVMTSLRDRLVKVSPRALVHTALIGVIAFVASIVFNPFHLTNLTHTFIISISEDAEGWRKVHEWWPAFAWDNPVGTGFPLLVMLILAVGLLALWLFSRFLVPKYLKPRKEILQAQQKKFTMLWAVLLYALAILVCWTASVSFSLSDASPQNLLLCALFAAVVWAGATKNIHLIYLVVPLTLFGLYTSSQARQYDGRYIYPFVVIPIFVVADLAASLLKKDRSRRLYDILFVIAAAAAGLILMTLLLNPFKLASIWNIDQWGKLMRLWGSPYERNLELSYKYLFPTLYILNPLAAVVWLAVTYLRKIAPPAAGGEARPALPDYQLPKVDLALLTIAGMTVYMAIRSRRFIPIAGIATCPVIAMLLDQMVRTIASARNFYRTTRLSVPPMTRGTQRFLICIGAAVTLFLGIYWGLKFKRVYLDPWPTDSVLKSMFMRMTASHAKPFYACKFITDNKLSGKMFNYWTEGGFIAWGQQPDPNTGRTPLQLFMDGRAQAAYDYSAYQMWMGIYQDNEIVRSAAMRGREMTPEEYTRLAAWLSEQLRAHNVWVTMMPPTEFDKPFVLAMDRNPAEWPLVFLSDKEKIWVDIKTPQGRALWEGIWTGATVYPDEYYKDLMIAHRSLTVGNNIAARKEGLDAAIRALRKMPSRTPVQIINLFYEYVPELRTQILEFYRDYFDDYTKNKVRYQHEDNYHHKAVTALFAAEYLLKAAAARSDNEQMAFYGNARQELLAGLGTLGDKKW